MQRPRGAQLVALAGIVLCVSVAAQVRGSSSERAEQPAEIVLPAVRPPGDSDTAWMVSCGATRLDTANTDAIRSGPFRIGEHPLGVVVLLGSEHAIGEGEWRPLFSRGGSGQSGIRELFPYRVILSSQAGRLRVNVYLRWSVLLARFGLVMETQSPRIGSVADDVSVVGGKVPSVGARVRRAAGLSLEGNPACGEFVASADDAAHVAGADVLDLVVEEPSGEIHELTLRSSPLGNAIMPRSWPPSPEDYERGWSLLDLDPPPPSPAAMDLRDFDAAGGASPR